MAYVRFFLTGFARGIGLLGICLINTPYLKFVPMIYTYKTSRIPAVPVIFKAWRCALLLWDARGCCGNSSFGIHFWRELDKYIQRVCATHLTGLVTFPYIVSILIILNLGLAVQR